MNIILAKSKTYQFNANSLVNPLGQYLFKNLDGATNFEKSSNMCEVTTIVLYQMPYEIRKKYNIPDSEATDVHEKELGINITSYNQKIRINILDNDENQETLGIKVIDLSIPKYAKYQSQNLRVKLFELIKSEIEKFIKKKLEDKYQYYDFLY